MSAPPATAPARASPATLLGAVACAALAAGCGSGPAPRPSITPPTPDPRPLVLCLGTSLTAGFGLEDPAQAWPRRLQERLDREGLAYRVRNAGLSGETSAGALRRIHWVMNEPVAVLVLETGANDGLRGLDPADLGRNIAGIVARARQQSPPPRILLVAMEAPPNLGEDYARRFRGVFAAQAEALDLALMPFLLEGIAGVPGLNQADGIHPTAAGHQKIADRVFEALRPLL